MKMPTIPGSGGAAWSLSTWATNAKRAGKRAEIDVQEGPAARADLLRCNWHFGGSQHVVRVSTGQDLAAKFHTYWMEVHAKRVVIGMDGTTCRTSASRPDIEVTAGGPSCRPRSAHVRLHGGSPARTQRRTGRTRSLWTLSA